MSGRTSPVPPGLLEAHAAHQRAVRDTDPSVLGRLIADEPTTLRGDADGLLVGPEAVTALRLGHDGAQPTSLQTHVRVIDDDHALVVSVTAPARGGRGLQTQLWARDPSAAAYGGWRVVAAHVTDPAPALDTRVWRVVGDPLVATTDPDGPLAGETVAVKDLYAVAGHPIGASNPARLAAAEPQPRHAVVVERLLAAGADVVGIARTDEFAWSLAGSNTHYGTPPNPAAPHRLPGGSSSGSASAVALGQASIGLGTDTGGSVRVPAAYQGLFGLRTTHGLVPRVGLMPLAPSFDTVGWFTRSAELLRVVGEQLLPAEPGAPRPSTPRLVAVPELLGLAERDVEDAVTAWLPPGSARESWPLPHLDTWLGAFQTVQAWEAWEAHGGWLETRFDTLGADVRERFERARSTTAVQATAARAVVDEARAEVRERVGDRVVVLPSAATVAPLPGSGPAARLATLRLTCLAGLGGLPALSLPVRTTALLPTGVCLVAAPGRDRDLLDLAVDLDRGGR